jgi:putative hydrolase of the HAD superfamily
MNEILNNKKVVFFDLGYTVLYPASGDWMFTAKFNSFASKRLEAINPERISDAVKECTGKLMKHHLCLDEKTELEEFTHFYTDLSAALELGLTHEQIGEIASDHTFNTANYVPYPDAVKVLSALKSRFALGVISDTWPSIVNKLRAHDLLDFFSFTTFSFSFGICKPEPEMFLDALSKCGCEAKDTVFIDDNPANIAASAKFGITPVLIAATPGTDHDVPFLKIHSLSELL